MTPTQGSFSDKTKLSKNQLLKNFWRSTGIIWALVVLVIIMTLAEPAFLSKGNILTILKQASITGVLAIGMMMVIVSGGIDLGVGSVLAVSCVASAYFATKAMGLPIAVPFIVGIGIGCAFGALNGIGISYIGFAPFIMTMATLSIARGVALVATNKKPIFNLNPEFIKVSNDFFVNLPSLLFYFLFVSLIGYVLTKKTVFGKWLYSIGGNERAALFSGINVKMIKTIIYTMMGALSGLTGVLMASRITSGNPTVGESYELDAIAACVIGGVSMSGGTGTVVGTVAGVLILGVISNGLDILGISSDYQKIMKGFIILLAVFIDIRARKQGKA
jgi:ribose/xylose/arabinose/galactoside ABC-type transport system permease subunit